MKLIYFVPYLIVSLITRSGTNCLSIQNYNYTRIEDSPYVAVVMVCEAGNCELADKYCGAAILSEYWVLSSAECFESMYHDDDHKIDCVCPEYISLATKVDALPPDTEIRRHEIEEVHIANNSISVDAERMVLIKLKKPIHFDETQQPIQLGTPVDRPNDSDLVQLIGFKFNNENETEHLGSIFMSIKNSCYERFPDLVKDCFCTTDYNYYQIDAGGISHFLAGTPVIFNKKLVGFDPNTVTIPDQNNNATYAIFMNVVNMYEWIMNTIKH